MLMIVNHLVMYVIKKHIDPQCQIMNIVKFVIIANLSMEISKAKQI